MPNVNATACKHLLMAALCAAMLSACSSDPIPPGSIDGTAETASIEAVDNTGPADQTYAAPVSPVTQTSDAVAPQSIEETGISMDEGLGVAPATSPATSLAEEEASNIAETNPSQPVVDGIGTDNPVSLTPQQTFQAQVEEGTVKLPARRVQPKGDETEVAFMPRFSSPEQVPESLGGMTAADRDCRSQLKKLGVHFTELEPIRDSAVCTIAHPIKVSGLAGGIDIKPAATLNCPVTLAFAKWVRNELVPSARLRYMSGVKTIYQMSSYSCRRMNSSRNNPWSEHARGNAIDVGKFILKSGKEIDVEKKGFFAFREKGLLKAVRTDSCRYFNTVLGPGSDVHHKDHFHFDLRNRNSNRRYCSI